MSTIESLNSQYINIKKSLEDLHAYGSRITEAQRTETSTVGRINSSLTYLEDIASHIDCTGNFLLVDTLEVGWQYLACLSSIRDYKSALIDADGIGKFSPQRVKDRVITEQKRYDELKESYRIKYDFAIDSGDALCKAILACVGNSEDYLQKRIHELQEEARGLEDADLNIELQGKEEPVPAVSLPERFLLGKYKDEKISIQILSDLGITDSDKGVYSDLKTEGNVIVDTPIENMDDSQLDNFILSYILRYIEAFPLGNVNVHVFGQNTNYLYKRLSNSFQSENAGESTKKVVKIHTDLSYLATLRDVVCEDIFKKIPVNSNLYSLYQYDSTDPFNLIVLRDGLVDGNGYASDEHLSTVALLSKPGDTGHRCGLRFLIINNCCSFDNSLATNVTHKISQIQENCGIVMEYANSQFSIDDRKIEVLHIAEEPDSFIQQRAQFIANTLNNIESNHISLEEVFTDVTENNPGSILSIPVGKAGASIEEIPFSCKDDKKTVAGVAGQCIGYMVIGQSGSGKSSFFHSLVLNGCMKYSPRDLQFWLLDFKNGGASSKYSNSGLPHIRMIAENNKIDDALCLFQMVLDEMERRSSIFNKNLVDNIIDYNKLAEEQGLEYFPRIIIAIDEIQEIFRDDNAAELGRLISSISSRMRSMGMHFVMVAQNLNDGKSYMLKDSFMPSVTGRICFRVALNIPRDSGFGEEFTQRSKEIAELKTGEAYISYGKDTIKRVKMAFIAPPEMSTQCFPVIKGKYPEFSGRKPNVIGSKQRLTINTLLQGEKVKYCDVVKEIQVHRGNRVAIIGEDAYRMRPLRIEFSQYSNSSVMLLGSDKQIASSLCTSIALSLIRQRAKIHLFNGDRIKIQTDNEAMPHSFMYLCQNVSSYNTSAEKHKMSELGEVVREIYSEYLRRKSVLQDADDEDLEFDPLFLIVNDLYAIDSFVNNDVITNNQGETYRTEPSDAGFSFDYNIFDQFNGNDAIDQFQKNIQDIFSTLIKEGWRYNIHMILAIKGDPSEWRNSRVVSGTNNIVLFNTNEYVDSLENSYYIKEMLKNISNDREDESMAVWLSKKRLSKIRPIIYDMSNQEEQLSVNDLLKGD